MFSVLVQQQIVLLICSELLWEMWVKFWCDSSVLLLSTSWFTALMCGNFLVKIFSLLQDLKLSSHEMSEDIFNGDA